MASADNQGYVKHAMAGLLALLMTPSAALAESKLLFLSVNFPAFGCAVCRSDLNQAHDPVHPRVSRSSPGGGLVIKLVVLSLIGLILCAAAVTGHAQSCTQREPTPDTGYGPHDFSSGVADSSLWREGDPGEQLFLRARVIDRCGQPVAGARVRIVHANHHGGHEADRWRADLRTDERGAFRLRTIFPGYTGGIPRHIHFIISHPQYPELATRLFFRNDPEFDHGIEDLSMTLEEIRRDSKRAWAASYEFVIGDG